MLFVQWYNEAELSWWPGDMGWDMWCWINIGQWSQSDRHQSPTPTTSRNYLVQTWQINEQFIPLNIMLVDNTLTSHIWQTKSTTFWTKYLAIDDRVDISSKSWSSFINDYFAGDCIVSFTNLKRVIFYHMLIVGGLDVLWCCNV